MQQDIKKQEHTQLEGCLGIPRAIFFNHSFWPWSTTLTLSKIPPSLNGKKWLSPSHGSFTLLQLAFFFFSLFFLSLLLQISPFFSCSSFLPLFCVFLSKPCPYPVPSAAREQPTSVPFSTPKTALPSCRAAREKKVGKIKINK